MIFLSQKSNTILEEKRKPIVGITLGDINGIGPQIVLKALEEERMHRSCQFVVFGTELAIQFYKKRNPELKLQFHIIQKQDEFKLHSKLPTLLECSEKPVEVQMGESNDSSGSLSLRFINDALFYLQQKKIDILVTAPINKAFIKTNPPFSGHTEYLAQKANIKDNLMIMTSDTIRVALATQHVPLQEVASKLTVQNLVNTIGLFDKSLTFDFGCQRPKIAILALNPHGGENGKIGREEIDIIAPAIQQAQKNKIIVQGPFSSDSFFSSGKYAAFDGILAMYHDQGLIPFKYIAGYEGVNFTANLPYVRTSPDHGVALDIVESGSANHNSMIHAIWTALDIYQTRHIQESIRSNKLKIVSIKDL